MHFESHCPLEEEVVAFEAKRGAHTEKKTEKHLRKAEKSEEEEEAPHLSEEEQEAAKSQPRRRKVGVWSSHESQN